MQSQLSKQQNLYNFNSQASTPRLDMTDSFSPSSSTSSPSSSASSTPSATPRQLTHSISQQSRESTMSSRPSSAHSGYSVPFSDLSSTFSDSSQLTNSSLIMQLDHLHCRDIHLMENLRDEWNRLYFLFPK